MHINTHQQKGGVISASCNKLANNIWNSAEVQDIWIAAFHVPGVKNTTVDLRSRHFYDNNKWSLNQMAPMFLFNQFEKPEIYLFTSLLNTKCTKYASYKPDLDSYHVNTFFLCWSDFNPNIFSSFNIVERLLAKLAQDWAMESWSLGALESDPC